MAINSISMDDLLARLQAAREAVANAPARAAAPAGAAATAAAGSAGAAPKVDFASLLKSTLDRVDQSQQRAETLGREFQLGNPKVSLEETMISVQQANITLQTAVQVRNKFIAAYNDIMNIQV
jgi:flagellar hook-basal body complex protein FliE